MYCGAIIDRRDTVPVTSMLNASLSDQIEEASMDFEISWMTPINNARKAFVADDLDAATESIWLAFDSLTEEDDSTDVYAASLNIVSEYILGCISGDGYLGGALEVLDATGMDFDSEDKVYALSDPIALMSISIVAEDDPDRIESLVISTFNIVGDALHTIVSPVCIAEVLDMLIPTMGVLSRIAEDNPDSDLTIMINDLLDIMDHVDDMMEGIDDSAICPDDEPNDAVLEARDIIGRFYREYDALSPEDKLDLLGNYFTLMFPQDESEE